MQTSGVRESSSVDRSWQWALSKGHRGADLRCARAGAYSITSPGYPFIAFRLPKSKSLHSQVLERIEPTLYKIGTYNVHRHNLSSKAPPNYRLGPPILLIVFTLVE